MKRLHNLKDAQIIINDIIDFYNNKRPHMSILLTPILMSRTSYIGPWF